MAHLTVRLLECVFASDQFITRGGRPIYLGGGFQIRRSSRSDESERVQRAHVVYEKITAIAGECEMPTS